MFHNFMTQEKYFGYRVFISSVIVFAIYFFATNDCEQYVAKILSYGFCGYLFNLLVTTMANYFAKR